MSRSEKVILTYGTFDLFHIGHINLLERARSLGDRLIVGVSTDEFNSTKGKKSFFKYSDRCKIVESCKYVDLVIPENSWDQKEKDIKEFNVTEFVMGDDWREKFNHLNALCKVTYLPRTPGISSTQVKKLSGAAVNGALVEELRKAHKSLAEILGKFENLN